VIGVAVGKNIVIFSDGTGQRGGIFVDENISNIYKLYRATRCGPESSVNPAEQVAFYNPGIGTLAPGTGSIGSVSRRMYNLVSQALGLGLTGNIIDCYAAIVRMWRPGDRIFLFGFSRGAYTIRCLAATICKCGIPTRMKDGSPLRYDAATSMTIAREAVRNIYQHTSSWDKSTATPRQLELLDQRDALAARFREQYGTAVANEPNVYPHFIGVFDTVASLSNPAALAGLVALVPVLAAAAGAVIWWSLATFFGIATLWWHWFLVLTLGVGVVSWSSNMLSRIRVAFGLKAYPWFRTIHLAEPRMNFYDHTLNTNVGFARHALSIDEARASFQRVEWGEPGISKQSVPQWFAQLWFAGNHSDIGGSYCENESRLSDVSLEWMLEAAVAVGLKHDPLLIRLYPDHGGPGHDETRSSVFRFAGKKLRRIQNDAPLHESVMKRFTADSILNYNVMEPYRPENLRDHDKLQHYFTGE